VRSKADKEPISCGGGESEEEEVIGAGIGESGIEKLR